MKRNDVLSAASSVTPIDGIARRIVQHAARGTPDSLSERLEEEWLAHLESRPGRTAQILFALGCCWATRVIAFEHGEEKVAAASTPTGQKAMTAYAQHDSSLFSRRTIILFTIIGLHVLLVYALQSGLTRDIIKITSPDLVVEFKDPEVKPTPPPPPPEQPAFTKPAVVEVPQPLVAIEDPPPAMNTVHAIVNNGPVVAPTLEPQRAVRRVIGGPGRGFPSTDDFYPATSRRLGEQGVSTVNVCVDERGKLTEAPVLAQSSGFPRLDESALKLAKAGSGHYRPTTEDGRAVNGCYGFRVKHVLK